MTGGGCTVVTFRPHVANYKDFSSILDFCNNNGVNFNGLLNRMIPAMAECLRDRVSDDEPLTANLDLGDINLRQK